MSILPSLPDRRNRGSRRFRTAAPDPEE